MLNRLAVYHAQTEAAGRVLLASGRRPATRARRSTARSTGSASVEAIRDGRLAALNLTSQLAAHDGPTQRVLRPVRRRDRRHQRQRRGVIETARKHRDRIGKVYAGRNGIIGALTEDLIDTSRESAARDRRAALHARRARSARAATS